MLSLSTLLFTLMTMSVLHESVGRYPPPTGACCSEGDCTIQTRADCEDEYGVYQGDGTACSPSRCPIGACCYADDGCYMESSEECAEYGGHFFGNGTDCAHVPCDVVGEGACLFPQSGACSIDTEAGCEEEGGAYQGDDTACEESEAEGACRFDDGSCSLETEIDCNDDGGEYQGDDTECDEGAPGVCLLGLCNCSVTTLIECDALEGTFVGNVSDCSDVIENGLGTCKCDLDQANGLESQDFYDFLEMFFRGESDFNCDQINDSQDYFDFMECFFQGCPDCSVIMAPTSCVAARDDGSCELDVVVTWDDTSNNESGFRVARRLAGDSDWDFIGETPPNVTIFRDQSGLQAGVRYDYHVRAFRECPEGVRYSEYSNDDASIPRPFRLATPTGCTATRDEQSCLLGVTVCWQDTSTGEGGFRIARRLSGEIDWDFVGSVGANQTCFHDTNNLGNGARYEYHVRAYRDCPSGRVYSAYSNEEASIPRLPSIVAPSNCLATRDDTTCELDVIVSWADNSNNEGGFRIARRRSDETDWTHIGTVGTGIVTFRDASSALVDGQSYFYHVRAFLDCPVETVYSDYSNEESSIPRLPAIAAPSNCIAARDDASCELDVVVTWNDNSNNESGFRIARRRSDETDWTHIGTVGAGATMFRDNGPIQADMRYYYHVRAYLNCTSVTVYSEYSNEESSIPRNLVVAAPSNCNAARQSGTPAIDVLITWQDNSNNETRFQIARRRDNGPYNTFFETVAGQTSYLDTQGLVRGHRYWYKVRAIHDCSTGGTVTSDWSNEEFSDP